MSEALSPLTSARMFDKRSNEALAQWLDNDADEMDGKPGYNNHVAAVRAAAERLRSVPAEPHQSEEWGELVAATALLGAAVGRWDSARSAYVAKFPAAREETIK